MPARTIVYLCDRDLRPVTDPVAWTQVDVTVRHLEPGTAMVTCAATPQVMSELAAANEVGRVLVVQHAGEVWLAGPVERPHGDYRWSAGAAETAEPGQVTFYATDYLALLAARVTYPDPSRPFGDQTTAEYYTDTGTASTVLLNLVDANAGPSAHTDPDRRVPRLVMGVDPHVGPTVEIATRFKWLLDEARSIVTRAGGAIGYRTVFDQAARTVTFEVYGTQDLSRTVRFSAALGNLRSVDLSTELPKATSLLVAGQGEGTARTTVERSSPTAVSLWRLEEFRDARNQATTEGLEAAGDERLAERAAKVRLATETVATADQPIGLDMLGALVTVEPRPGLELVDTVRAIHLQVTPRAGAVITAQVGAQSQTSEPEWLRITRDLARRLSTLEGI